MDIALVSTNDSVQMPGIRHISSFLKLRGHKPSLLFLSKQRGHMPTNPENIRTAPYSAREMSIVGRLVRRSDLICIGSVSFFSQRTLQLIRSLRELGIPIIWGGPHPTMVPELCLKEVDAVCAGEGETALAKAADRLESGEGLGSLPHLWRREDGRVRPGTCLPLVRDLDSLGGHDFDLTSQFVLENGRLVPFSERHLDGTLYISSVRGCPFDCSFCWMSQHHLLYGSTSVRYRSPSNLVEEMAHLVRRFRSVKWISLKNEDDFVIPAKAIAEFSQHYRDEISLPFDVHGNPLTITENKLSSFLDAGLRGISVGIQSGSERTNWEVYNRKISRERILSVAHLLNRYSDRISIYYNFIHNNPYENEEDIRATLRLIMSLPRPYSLGSLPLIFFPGTRLYERASHEGLIPQGTGHEFPVGQPQTGRTAYLNNLLAMCVNGLATETRVGGIPRRLFSPLTSPVALTLNGHLPQISAAARRCYYTVKQIVDTFKLRHAQKRGIPAFTVLNENALHRKT